MSKSVDKTPVIPPSSSGVLKQLALQHVCVKIGVIVCLIITGLLVVVACLSLALVITPWSPLICFGLLVVAMIATGIIAVRLNKRPKEKTTPEPLKPITQPSAAGVSKEELPLSPPSPPASPLTKTEAAIQKLMGTEGKVTSQETVPPLAPNEETFLLEGIRS